AGAAGRRRRARDRPHGRRRRPGPGRLRLAAAARQGRAGGRGARGAGPSPGRAATSPPRALRGLEGPLLTTVVGSYPQPGWLIDRSALGARLPPRTRARELWRIPPDRLREAQDDATLLAVRDFERA